MAEPAYPDFSPQLGMGVCIFLEFFRDLTGAILLVVGDVSIDSEVSIW